MKNCTSQLGLLQRAPVKMLYQKSTQNGPRAQKATRINHLFSVLPAIHAAMQQTGRSSTKALNAKKFIRPSHLCFAFKERMVRT
jgi:hypothetical protein